MELGILEDDRAVQNDVSRNLSLTASGMELRSALEDDLRSVNLAFPVDVGNIPSSRMTEDEDFYNALILNSVKRGATSKRVIFEVFLRMNAVQQMLAFLFYVIREKAVTKNKIYEEFFASPFVKRFCEQEGIEEADLEASRRRCPFLLNVLVACGILTKDQSAVHLQKLMLLPSLVKPNAREDMALTRARYEAVKIAWPENSAALTPEDLSIVRELFGASFLNPGYFLTDMDFAEV